MQKISKSLIPIANKITERDVHALKSIYDLRCLTQHQIYKLHYSKSVKTKKPVSDSYCKTKIQLFLELNIIEKIEYNSKDFCFMLTSRGVDIIRAHFNLPHNIFDKNYRVVKRGYLRASELKINKRLIPHQLMLNQFYIDMLLYDINYPFLYEDAKHAKSFTSILPDAFLTAFDTTFFIEMDMGTESKKLLCEKWHHYREFLKSDEFYFSERNIVVLFIIENIDNVQPRIDLVKSTYFEILGDLNLTNFDMYVGDKETIIECLYENFFKKPKDLTVKTSILSDLLLNSHNIQTKPFELLPEFFKQESRFELLAKKRIDSESYFFLFDYADFFPISFLTKIANFEVTQNLLYNRTAKTINFIFIVESLKEAYHELNVINLFNHSIFITTLSRLKTLPFQEALCSMDAMGNVFTLSENLQSKTFAFNILDK